VWKGPILDQHMHLDRENRFLKAISDFVQSGGTGIMLVHKPGFSGALPTDIDGYRFAYSETLGMANEVRDTHGVDVGVVLGPHPVAWEHQIEPLGLERSTELHIEAVGLALDHIEAGGQLPWRGRPPPLSRRRDDLDSRQRSATRDHVDGIRRWRGDTVACRGQRGEDM